VVSAVSEVSDFPLSITQHISSSHIHKMCIERQRSELVGEIEKSLTSLISLTRQRASHCGDGRASLRLRPRPCQCKVGRSRGLMLENPPRRCSPTSGATAIPFHILVRDDPLEKLRGRIISGRLGLLIRNIKPKRQRTFISSQPSPSAAKSLFVFNPLGIEKTETDWEENTGG
jgi:hypothetical protein